MAARLAVIAERRAGETRAALSPESAKKLIAMGVEVTVESGAGAGASIPDGDYSSAGAYVVPSAEAALADAQLVFGVRSPEPVQAIRPGSVVVAMLNPHAEGERLRQLGERGVDFVFAPSVDEMYPQGAVETRVTAGPAGNTLEGRSRPGHFDGVLTVVAKLLNTVQPEVVVFGQKDAQQVFLVQRMIRDLSFPVTVEVVETVRAEDGLALSSRNQFLNPAERRAARVIPRALEAAASAAERGIDAVVAAAQGALMGEEHVQVDYLRLVDPASFGPLDDGYRGPAMVLIAARVGTTRLIDNAPILLGRR